MNKEINASSTPKKNRSHLHPNTQTMVDEAFKVLNKNKCSYQAIKHYIQTRYLVDMRFLLNRIKSYIRESVANGKLIQMTGHGLNGSFRLSAAAKRNPKKFVKKSIRKRSTNELKSVKKTTTFLIESIHRRTSLTRSRTRHIVPQPERSPEARLAKNEMQTGIDSDDDLPSTSTEAIQKVMNTRTKMSFKMSHMF